MPDGFAVPFYFYDEFMKHNDLYGDVREMLADPDFQSDYDTKVDGAQEAAQEDQEGRDAGVDRDGSDRRCTQPTRRDTSPALTGRAPTTRTFPGSTGPGLYDSKTQHPEETEEDGISKSLKQVYASLWNFRAFIERDFQRVDHLADCDGSTGASQLLGRAGQRRRGKHRPRLRHGGDVTTSTRSLGRTWSPIRKPTRLPEEILLILRTVHTTAFVRALSNLVAIRDSC